MRTAHKRSSPKPGWWRNEPRRPAPFRRPAASRWTTLDRDGALPETAEQLPRTDRGGFLRAGAVSVLAAGLAWPRAASAADRKADLDVLNYALSLEYLQAAFYTEAERLRSLRGEFREQARVVGSHERAHVAALRPCSATRRSRSPSSTSRA